MLSYHQAQQSSKPRISSLEVQWFLSNSNVPEIALLRICLLWSFYNLQWELELVSNSVCILKLAGQALLRPFVLARSPHEWCEDSIAYQKLILLCKSWDFASQFHLQRSNVIDLICTDSEEVWWRNSAFQYSCYKEKWISFDSRGMLLISTTQVSVRISDHTKWWFAMQLFV